MLKLSNIYIYIYIFHLNSLKNKIKKIPLNRQWDKPPQSQEPVANQKISQSQITIRQLIVSHQHQHQHTTTPTDKTKKKKSRTRPKY